MVDRVELQRLRALLAARAMQDAPAQRGRLAKLVSVLKEAPSKRGSEDAGAPSRGRADEARCAAPRFSPAPRPATLRPAVAETAGLQGRDPLIEAYALSGFAPRRTVFGSRAARAPAAEEARPIAPTQDGHDQAAVVPASPEPTASRLKRHDAETPFFPEDLADANEAAAAVWSPPPSLELALRSDADPPCADLGDENPSSVPRRDYLLAYLASRLAGEQFNLETKLRTAQHLERLVSDALAASNAGTPSKAA